MRLSNIKEGYEVLPRMNREKYQERPGLEGPIMTRSGKVVYYDNKEGMYYDPDTDMYISYDDWKMLDSPSMHKVSEKDSIKPFDTISARAIRDLKQRYPHAKDPVNALVLDIEKNEMDSDRADDEADEERDSIMSRIAKIEKELGITEKFMSRRPGTDTVNKAIAIAKKMKGNMTGAVKSIEKIRQGLSDEPSVANALRMANEDIKQPGKDAAIAGAKVLAGLEAIVKDKSAKAVQFMDGKSKVDLFTASAVLQVYNAVKDDNKQKLLNLMSDRQGFVKAAKIAFKMSENTEMKIENIKENQINEGVLDDTDEDGWMAKSQLYKAAKYAIKLHSMISDQDNLEPWVQAKITKASDYLQVVKHYMEYEGMNPYPMEGLQEDNEEATSMADHYFDMAKQDDANDGMDGDYFRMVARAVFRGDPQEMRDIILDGDTEPRERVLDHMARNYPDMLRKIFPKDADNASYLATMREAEEKHYMCVHAQKGTHKCSADSTYAAAKKAAKMWNMKSTAGIDVKLMDVPQTASEGHSPHKKGSAKYKKHMAAKHAGMGESKSQGDAWYIEQDAKRMAEKDGKDWESMPYGYKMSYRQKAAEMRGGDEDDMYEGAEKRWKQTSMSAADAIKKYGKENVKVKKGGLRNGDDMVEILSEDDMYEGAEKQLEKQAIDFFTSIKSKINTTGGR